MATLEFAANFTAIDFETANRRPDSACQLAAVVVRDGRIVDSSMWMIRPEPFYFSRSNIAIHGITPERVSGERTFAGCWPEIAQRLGPGECLVAHNASFDIGVLLACLRNHRQPIPEFQYTCTRAVARRTWPHQRRFGLKPLATWLGIRFRHHDALEDSIACAKILLAAGIDREATSVESLEKSLRLTRGTAGPWGKSGPAAQRRSRARTVTAMSTPPLPFLTPGQVASPTEAYATESAAADPDEIDLQRLMIRAEFIRPLLGMRVAFTGQLKALNRDQAEMLANKLGGTCQGEVDDSTNLLVVGQRRSSGQAGLSRKHRVAQILSDQGAAIRIVDESEFLGLLIHTA